MGTLGFDYYPFKLSIGFSGRCLLLELFDFVFVMEMVVIAVQILVMLTQSFVSFSAVDGTFLQDSERGLVDD